MACGPTLMDQEQESPRTDACPGPCLGPHVLAQLTQAHRVELAELRALVVRYRYVLEEHGITPPDDSGAEALARFRHAFQMAGMYDSMQHPELLADWTRRPL